MRMKVWGRTVVYVYWLSLTTKMCGKYKNILIYRVFLSMSNIGLFYGVVSYFCLRGIWAGKITHPPGNPEALLLLLLIHPRRRQSDLRHGGGRLFARPAGGRSHSWGFTAVCVCVCARACVCKRYIAKTVPCSLCADVDMRTGYEQITIPYFDPLYKKKKEMLLYLHISQLL